VAPLDLEGRSRGFAVTATNRGMIGAVAISAATGRSRRLMLKCSPVAARLINKENASYFRRSCGA